MHAASVAAVVPTLGRSPLLAACVASLRSNGIAQVLLVHQGSSSIETLAQGAEILSLGGLRHGFARAANAGVARVETEWLALVNDDAVLESDWLERILAAAGGAEVGALQGLNVLGAPQSAESARIDSLGFGWNRWWQATQLLHGVPLEQLLPKLPSEEVLGCTATATLYRVAALRAAHRFVPALWRQPVSGAAENVLQVFDSALDTYYEDVDLGVRLRACGFRALVVPGARAWHAGSSSAPPTADVLRYGNRLLVLARLLGRRYALALPRALARDILDLTRGKVAAGTLAAAWVRTLRHAARFAHCSAPLVARPLLRSLGTEVLEGRWRARGAPS